MDIPAVPDPAPAGLVEGRSSTATLVDRGDSQGEAGEAPPESLKRQHGKRTCLSLASIATLISYGKLVDETMEKIESFQKKLLERGVFKKDIPEIKRMAKAVPAMDFYFPVSWLGLGRSEG
jgi:hypothetical protein